jgi:PAS domain S-box-containing protein
VALLCTHTVANDVVLAVEEACTNAIRHSGSSDDIEIRLALEGGDLTAAVKDKGRGFDVESFDPERTPDPLLDHGRGLFLISQLCDEMQLRRDHGLEVRFVKRDAMPANVRAAHDDALGTGVAGEHHDDTRQRMFLEEIDELFAALDWEFRYIYVNKRFCLIIGRSAEELLGNTLWELFPEIVGTDVEQRLLDAMNLGLPSRYEFYFPPLESWFEQRLYPTAYGINQFSIEINERKRKELEGDALVEALRTSEERQAFLFKHAPAAIYEMDYRGPSIVSVNDFACDFSGRTREELLAMNPLDLLSGPDRDVFEQRIRQTLVGETLEPEIEYRVVNKQGEERWALLNAAPIFEQGEAIGAFVVAHDVTERKRREIDLALLAELAVEFAHRSSAEQIMAAVCTRLAAHLDVATCLVTAVDETTDGALVEYAWDRDGGLEVAGPQRLSDLVSEEFRRAARSGATVVVGDTQTDPRVDAAGHAALGIYAGVNVPLRRDDRWSYLFSAGVRSARVWRHDEIELIEEVASRTLPQLERARAEESLRETARLSRALVAIDALVLSSLRPEEIVEAALREGAQAIGAETAGLNLHDDAERRFRVAYVYNYPADRVGILIPDADDTHGVLAMRTGQAVAIDDTRTDPRVVPELMAAWRIKSVVCAPLSVGGRAIGVAYYSYHATAHRFSAPETDFVARLASLLSAALQNAAAYEEQRDLATALQENLLHPLPQVAGLEIGVASATASEAELVGGDFCDVFVLRDGRVAIAVGDVAGKGVRAAGMTETVRAKIRAFATIEPSPDFVLAKTNELLLLLDPDQPHVTVFLGLLDPRTGHLTYASAGHPPPVHLSHAGRALDITYGPPLGTFASAYTAAQTTLTGDDYLVLYTDGVTEARRDGVMYGEERLVETVVGLHGQPAQELADGLLRNVAAFASRLADDIQIVALRLA